MANSRAGFDQLSGRSEKSDALAAIAGICPALTANAHNIAVVFRPKYLFFIIHAPFI